MCGIWNEVDSRADELAPEDLDEILADRLFSAMEFVGVSGGEPFVREDLPEICRVILGRCAKVQRVSLTTNGLLCKRMSRTLPEIADEISAARRLLDVSVSVHGIGEGLDSIYGVDGAFQKIERTTELLEELRNDGRLSFSMNCVLLADNLHQARELKVWAADRTIPLNFVIGEDRHRFRTEGLDGAFATGDDMGELVGFLGELVDDPALSAVTAGKYREIIAMLEGRKERSLSCYYAMGGLVLGHDGRLFYCSHSRDIGSCRERSPWEIYVDPENLAYREEELIQRECRRCPPYTRTRREIGKDLPRVLIEVVRRRLRKPRSNS
jgi:MoaA/NifB/PqqE/SkfB family radical SAM enzyme